jgi:hypothetical protein
MQLESLIFIPLVVLSGVILATRGAQLKVKLWLIQILLLTLYFHKTLGSLDMITIFCGMVVIVILSIKEARGQWQSSPIPLKRWLILAPIPVLFISIFFVNMYEASLNSFSNIASVETTVNVVEILSCVFLIFSSLAYIGLKNWKQK